MMRSSERAGGLLQVIILLSFMCTPYLIAGAKYNNKDLKDICPKRKYIDAKRKICQDYCSDGYFTNHGSNICEKCSGTCETCNHDKSECTSCSRNLFFKDNSCVGIGKCKNSFLQFANESDIRLVNGGSSLEGRVEIRVSNVWGTICDDLWSKDDGDVVCKMLNMGHAIEVFSNAYFGSGSGSMPILLDDLRCDGSESHIDECLHGGIGMHDCSHKEDAGVKCSGPSFRTSCVKQCPSGYFRLGRICAPCNRYCEACQVTASNCTSCSSGFYLEGNKCVSSCSVGSYGHKSERKCMKCEDPACQLCEATELGSRCTLCMMNTFLSNGKCQTKCGSDEVFQTLGYVHVVRTEKLDYRSLNVSKNAIAFGGDIEISTPSGITYICDDNWDVLDAQVVCRQMGAEYALAATKGSRLYSIYFGEKRDSFKYRLTGFKCKGDETTILDCEHKVVPKGQCRSMDHAGVICSHGKGLKLTQVPYMCARTCKKGFYPKNGKCLLCSLECAACSHRTNHCTSCREPLFLSKNKCVSHCGIFEYGNTEMKKCLPCDRNKCGTCANGDRNDICLSCDEPQVLFNKQCVRRCGNGHVAKEGECVKECGIQYYQSSNKCLKCPKDCYSCKASGPNVTCLYCNAPKVLNVDGTCTDSCRFATFEKHLDIPYDEIGFSVKLLGGQVGGLAFFKEGNSWIPICSNGVTDQDKKIICKELHLGGLADWISGSSETPYNVSSIRSHVEKLRCGGNETSVSQCHRTISNTGDCPGTVLNVQCSGAAPKGCEKKCPNGYTQSPSKRECIKCSSYCTDCHNSRYNCSGCKKHRIFHNNQCLYSCPSGFVEDRQGKSCIACDANCERCDESDPKHCRSCKWPFVLNKRSCSRTCGDSFNVSLSSHLVPIVDRFGYSDVQFELKLNQSGKMGKFCTKHGFRWNENDIGVICRELRFGAPIVEGSFSRSMDFTREPVWMLSGHCTGNESSIVECGFLEYKERARCTFERFYCTGPDLSRICLDSCPAGFMIAPGKVCQQCHPSCKTCQGTETNCTECSDNYFRSEDGKCVRECPVGYYGSSKGNCQKCNPNCLTCTGDASLCANCKSSEFLQDKKCVSSCRSGMALGGSMSLALITLLQQRVPLLRPKMPSRFLPICASPQIKTASANTLCRELGYEKVESLSTIDYRDGDTRKRRCWEISAVTCSGLERQLSACKSYTKISLSSSSVVLSLRCSKGSLRYLCVDKCPDGFIKASDTCRPCSRRCKTCSGAIHSCQSCDVPFYLEGVACVRQCKRGFYGDINSRTCRKCDSTCAACVNGISGDYCTECVDGYILYNNKCVQRRPSNAVLVRDVVNRFWKMSNIRLVDGVSKRPSEGILQVYHEGEWGTVCASEFAYFRTVSTAACFELGYQGPADAETVKEQKMYRKVLKRTKISLGKIWLNLYVCPWGWSTVSTCSHSGWGVTSCNHDDDIYLNCTAKRNSVHRYDYYQDLNGHSCFPYLGNCDLGMGCLDVETFNGRNDSICLNCPKGTIHEGQHCRAIVNTNVEWKEPLINKTVNEGEYIKLSCLPKWDLVDPNLDGEFPRIAPEWFYGTTSLNVFERYRPVLGHTVDHFSVKFLASAATAGKYTCLLRTTAGDIRSSMYLTVRGKPVISLVRSPRDAKLHTSTELFCESRDQVTWSWYFKDTKVQGSNYDASKAGSLKIRKLDLSDVGQYKCVAVNDRGKAEATVELKIAVSIDAIVVPDRVVVDERKTAILNCSIIANGPVKTVWKFWGKHIPPSSKFSVSRIQKGLLTVNDVTLSEQGIYTCIGITDLMVKYKDVQLLINGAPHIYQPPQDVYAIRTAIVTFKCQAIGIPPLKYTWLRGNEIITRDDTHARFVNGDTVLQLLYVHEDQSGIYTCRVSNPNGKDQRAAKLKVLEVDINSGNLKDKLQKNKKKGFPLPSFGDTVFQVVFGPILGILMVILIIWCACRFRKRRQRAANNDQASTSVNNGGNTSCTVKYHIPSGAINMTEEDEDDDDYGGASEGMGYSHVSDKEKLVATS